MEEQRVIAIENNNLIATVEELKEKFLTFWADKQLYGLNIANVEQIVSMQEIVEIPEFPSYAKGIINLRGNIIPVIDMRLKLGKFEKAYDDRTCIIVTQISNNYFGFIVDEVDEVAEIKDNQISDTPHVGGGITNNFVMGVARLNDNGNEKIILCLELKKILRDDEFSSLIQNS